ncbi:MAG: amidohydrolase family protein [Actinomycetota bacterium]
MTRTLIKDGCVLSMDPRIGNHYEADVLLDGDTIAEVATGIRARDAELIDARDAIVMPGFVDTHRHVWESLFRNLGDPANAALPAAYAPHCTADDVYAATLVGLLGAAEAGITTVVDWCELGGPGHTDAALEAHADAGLRTVFVDADATGSDADSGWRARLRRLTATAPAPLRTLAAGPREPRHGDVERLSADWSLARELGLRIHSHAGGSADDRGVVADLAARGLLAADVTLVHCSHLDDTDLDAIRSSGAAVSLTPSSEMAGGLPPLPVQQLIDREIRPGLGIDAEQLAPGDMFAQIRATISLQHATHFDLRLAGKAGLPQLLSTREVIRYGTIDGARAVGLGGVTGSLTPGKQADVVVLRTDRPNIFPINDPIGAVVWGMDTSNIDWVLVAGRPLMRHGVLDADLDRARGLAATAQQRMAAAAGPPPVGTVAGEPV